MGERERRHVLGEWQHVPRVVTVLDEGDKRRAEVTTHQQWSILEQDESDPVHWEVMIVLPLELELYPVVFEEPQRATKWVETNDALRDLDLSAPQKSAAPANEKGAHHTLTLFSKYNGDGEHYEVPPGAGVDDWPGRRPHAAAVPNWMPRSFETSGRSDLYGHDYGKERRQKRVLLVGNHRINLPFPILDSASTD
jgi:hypothetical protein